MDNENRAAWEATCQRLVDEINAEAMGYKSASELALMEEIDAMNPATLKAAVGAQIDCLAPVVVKMAERWARLGARESVTRDECAVWDRTMRLAHAVLAIQTERLAAVRAAIVGPPAVEQNPAGPMFGDA